MLKLPSFFANEIKFSLRQGGLLFLLLLYPLLVIAIVGIAFSSQSTIKVPLGIYSDDAELLNSISQQGNFRVTTVNTPAAAELLVKRGAVPASIIITNCNYYFEPQTGACDKRLYIATVQDSSRATEVAFVKTLFNAALMDRLTLSAQEIVNFQSKATSVNNELPEMRRDLSTFRSNLISEQEELSSIKKGIKVEEIDSAISGMNDLIGFFDASIAGSENAIAQLGHVRNNVENEKSSTIYDLGEFYRNLGYIDTSLQQSKVKRDTYVARVNSYIARLDSANQQINNAYSAVSTAYNAAPSSILYNALTQVGQAQYEVQTARNDLYNARAELTAIDFDSMRIQVNNTRAYIANTESKVYFYAGESFSRIDNATATLNDFKSRSQEIKAKLEMNKAKLLSIRESAVAARARADEISSDIDKLIAKVDQTDAKLASSRVTISSFTSISPEEFTPPKMTDRNAIASSSRLLFNFPFLLMINIALFAVLFPIVITSKMAECGAEERLRRQGAVLSYIAGRFAGDYVIVVFQTMLFFLFAFVFFGVVPISLNLILQFCAILLVILPFTALGFLLSRMINKVAIGLLVSLLLFIPMVFLSGKILPFMFMDPIIGAIGSYQPFTVALNFLELSFFRCEISSSCDIYTAGFGIAYLVGISAAMLALSTLFWFLSTSTGRVKWGKKKG